MTMNEMNSRLVGCGFKVKREYDNREKAYRFTISKGDHYTSALFEYPEDPSDRDLKQRAFIESIMCKWENDHENIPMCMDTKVFASAIAQLVRDIKTTRDIYNKKKESNTMEIKKVHFNPPLTVVIWKDGTKTFVKASENDVFDPEKGLAMAIAKKAMGNKYSYINEIKKHLPKKED